MKKIIVIMFVASFLFIGCNKKEEITLTPIEHRLISFSYQKDTGNNSSLLEISIEYTNPNNFGIKGNYKVKFMRDNTLVELGGENESTSRIINANDKIVINISLEDPYQTNITPAETMSFVDASYIVTQYPL